MDGVGRGIAVRHHDAAGLVEPAPVLFVGSKAVYGKHGGSGAGVHVPGGSPQGAVQVQIGRLGKGVAVPGKVDLPAGNPPGLQAPQQQPRLGGLAGAVGALQNNQRSVHFRPFSFRTWTKNKGSFIIRFARQGFLHRR